MYVYMYIYMCIYIGINKRFKVSGKIMEHQTMEDELSAGMIEGFRFLLAVVGNCL